MDPVVGVCGHEFCQQCYTDWVVQSQQQDSLSFYKPLTCPLCRKTLSRTIPGKEASCETTREAPTRGASKDS